MHPCMMFVAKFANNWYVMLLNWSFSRLALRNYGLPVLYTIYFTISLKERCSIILLPQQLNCMVRKACGYKTIDQTWRLSREHVLCRSVLAYFCDTKNKHTAIYIHTFLGAPRGAFRQPIYSKCKLRWLKVLVKQLQAVHNVFLSETLSCALS